MWDFDVGNPRSEEDPNDITTLFEKISEHGHELKILEVNEANAKKKEKNKRRETYPWRPPFPSLKQRNMMRVSLKILLKKKYVCSWNATINTSKEIVLSIQTRTW